MGSKPIRTANLGIVMLQVKKVFQSPCTPVVELVYLVKISDPKDLMENATEFESKLIKDLEKLYIENGDNLIL